jgi:hypothetical protein
MNTITQMTSVSSYLIFKAKCCNSEVRIANYSSTNASTVFTTAFCECKKSTTIEELEFIRIDTPSAFKLKDGGVDNYELPSFVKRT